MELNETEKKMLELLNDYEAFDNQEQNWMANYFNMVLSEDKELGRKNGKWVFVPKKR